MTRRLLGIGLWFAFTTGCSSRGVAPGPDGAVADARFDLRPEDDVAPDGGPSDAASDAEAGLSAFCAAATQATVLDVSTPGANGTLDLAPATVEACDGAPVRAFFYSVEVPVGKQLTVLANATAGDRLWLPHLTASNCATTTCLARGSAVSGATQRLDWTNGGAAPRTVILAVWADAAVIGAEFALSIGFTDLLASCAAPLPLVDGTTLRNQTLANVRPSTSTCNRHAEPALYYVATLLPQQALEVSLTGRNGPSFAAQIGLRTACDDDCSGGGAPRASTLNLSTHPKTVIIELLRVSNEPFDLHVSLPPPPARIDVTPTSALVTTEAGGKATFEVAIASQPTADVVVALTSGHPSEGTASPASLTFDATNWTQAQKVTVTGVDDQVGDGAQKYTIVTAPAASGDPLYDGLDADDVPLTNLDDEASLVLDGVSNLVTSEDGVTATFTVRLNSAPSDTVDVPLASSSLGEGKAGPASLRFTSATWNTPQTVTVTGADDAVVDGPQPYTITLGPLVSNDARYGGLRPAGIVVHNRDDEISPVSRKVTNGGARCGISGTWNQFPVAVDAFGRIYMVFDCDDRLLAFTSADGGNTFSDPVPISKMGGSGSFALAAGHGGTAFAVFTTRGRGLALARTTDGGATWSERLLSPLEPDVLRIAAVRDTVVIVGESPLVGGQDPGTTTVLWSDDAGLSFRPPQIVDGKMSVLSLGRDAKSAWLVDFNQTLIESHDSGQTFTPVGLVEGSESCCYAFGTQNIYTVTEGQVALTKLSDVTKGPSITGLEGRPLAVAVDDLNAVTIYTSTSAGRFGPDLKLTTSPFGGSTIDHGGALVLSRHATAFVTLSLPGEIVFSIATWP